MKWLIPLVLILTGCANQDIRIGSIIGSEHYKEVPNEKHDGHYIVVNGYGYTEFDNSFDASSRAIFKQTKITDWYGIEIDYVLGLADGYKGFEYNHQYKPFAGITFRFGPAKLWQIGPVTLYGLEISNQDFIN